MTSSRTRTPRSPSARWLVPVAAAALVVGGPTIASLSADRVGLPERSAEQLLVSLQKVDVDAWSGTLETSVDLGVPGLAALAGASSTGALSLAMLVEGEQTVRVWRDAESGGSADRARMSILDDRGEFTLVHDGEAMWTYASDTGAVTSYVPPSAPSPERATPGTPGGLPLTPDLLAQTVLLTLEQSSDITVDGTALVAGRPAYELVVTPRSAETLIGSLRLAVDAETSLPLRGEVYARGAEDPAIAVGYTDVDLEAPEASVFEFTPPPGSEVEVVRPGPGASVMGGSVLRGVDVQQVGTGFDLVMTAQVPAEILGLAMGAGRPDKSQAAEQGDSSEAASRVLASLPEVSGPWGRGRLLRGALFSVVLADDGRVAAGAVRPQALYAALAS